jgi:hypothetical protein
MHSQLLDMGIHQQDAGDFVASVLKNSSKPLTRILERLSGTRLRIKVLDDGERALTDDERYRLGADGIARCRWRRGLLVAGDGTVAASVSLIWLPARLPFSACAELDAGAEPAGVVLGRLGMRREDRRAMATAGIEDVTGAGAAVRSTAVLAVGGRAVGIADECVTREFAGMLAVAD